MAENGATATEAEVLDCPLWTHFVDSETGRAFFYNVISGERAETDVCPDAGATFDEESGADGMASAKAQDEEIESWRLVPARVQVEWKPDNSAYTEGSEEYNIWYGKYLKDRVDRRERDPASTRCDPSIDEGYTRASAPGAGCAAFCLFFARGCCHMGYRCVYHHHVPSLEDCEMLDEAHDIFGRGRHASHRADFGGVGSFNSEGRTLFVGELVFDRTEPDDTIAKVEVELRTSFERFGQVENVRLIPRKAIGFVTFKMRGSAEFAKVAMNNQKLGLSPCVRVNWALDDRDPRQVKKRAAERKDQVQDAVDRCAAQRLKRQCWSISEILALEMNWCSAATTGVTGPYPEASDVSGAPLDDLTRLAAALERANPLHRDGTVQSQV